MMDSVREWNVHVVAVVFKKKTKTKHDTCLYKICSIVRHACLLITAYIALRLPDSIIDSNKHICLLPTV